MFGCRMAMSSDDISVVLAHGTWADGSSWARVITPLEKVKVFAAPFTSLADDVAALIMIADVPYTVFENAKR
jgi:hypothetical protein